jgi:hypothetical protein
MDEYNKNKDKYKGLGGPGGNGDGGNKGDGLGGLGGLGKGLLNGIDGNDTDRDGKGNRGKGNGSALKDGRGSQPVSFPAIKGNDALT